MYIIYLKEEFDVYPFERHYVLCNDDPKDPHFRDLFAVNIGNCMKFPTYLIAKIAAHREGRVNFYFQHKYRNKIFTKIVKWSFIQKIIRNQKDYNGVEELLGTSV